MWPSIQNEPSPRTVAQYSEPPERIFKTSPSRRTPPSISGSTADAPLSFLSARFFSLGCAARSDFPCCRISLPGRPTSLVTSSSTCFGANRMFTETSPMTKPSDVPSGFRSTVTRLTSTSTVTPLISSSVRLGGQHSQTQAASPLVPSPPRVDERPVTSQSGVTATYQAFQTKVARAGQRLLRSLVTWAASAQTAVHDWRQWAGPDPWHTCGNQLAVNTKRDKSKCEIATPVCRMQTS